MKIGINAFLNWCVFNEYNELGQYESEERALEVLNEIQRCFNGRTIISPRRITDYERIKEQFFDGDFIITDGSVDVIPSDVIVYEMPKE